MASEVAIAGLKGTQLREVGVRVIFREVNPLNLGLEDQRPAAPHTSLLLRGSSRGSCN